jgi:hypothetical protein
VVRLLRRVLAFYNVRVGALQFQIASATTMYLTR